MGLADHVSAADVMLGVSAKSKRTLLECMAAEAANRLGLSKQEIFEALQAREGLGSTALGKGVALPHAVLPGAVPPAILFARLRQPIDFDARDAEPVDLVFLVLWPAAATKGLLDALSEISRAVHDTHLLRRLRVAETPENVVQFLRQEGGRVTGQSARRRWEE